MVFLSLIIGNQNNFMKLPLLQFVSNQYQDVALDKTLVIACQHILGTTFNLFEELFEKGLKPQNVFIIGKCYSTNKETFDLFKKTGVNISDYSVMFDSHISFDEQFKSYIEEFLKNIQSSIDLNSFDKIIILDDGGYLITFSNDFLKDFSNVVGIEQTSSGYEKIKSIQTNFPVINIARSKAKLEIESPFIAEISVEKIEEYLLKYKITNPNILIVGVGYIGIAISILLKNKYKVSCCDILQQKCDFGGDYKNHLNEFDLIIGATGTSAILPQEFGILKNGVLLASVSSSDREFSAVYLRQLVKKVENCHEDIKINGITLLNCGFPINFNDGKQHIVIPEKIQITRALLLAGVFEAVTNKFPNNIIDLDYSLQERIIKEFSVLVKTH